MVKGEGAAKIRPVFQRGFVHGHMKSAAKSFAGNMLSDRWKGLVGKDVPRDLRAVAQAFVNLQEARHEADYDMSRQFSRSEVRDLIEMSQRARNAWQGVSNTAEGRVFLMALLMYKSVY